MYFFNERHYKYIVYTDDVTQWHIILTRSSICVTEIIYYGKLTLRKILRRYIIIQTIFQKITYSVCKILANKEGIYFVLSIIFFYFFFYEITITSLFYIILQTQVCIVQKTFSFPNFVIGLLTQSPTPQLLICFT